MACGRVLWAAMVLTWVFLLTGKGLTVALPDHFYYGRPTVHEQDLHSPDGGAEVAEHSTTKRPRSNNQDLGDQTSYYSNIGGQDGSGVPEATAELSFPWYDVASAAALREEPATSRVLRRQERGNKDSDEDDDSGGDDDDDDSKGDDDDDDDHDDDNGDDDDDDGGHNGDDGDDDDGGNGNGNGGNNDYGYYNFGNNNDDYFGFPARPQRPRPRPPPRRPQQPFFPSSRPRPRPRPPQRPHAYNPNNNFIHQTLYRGK
ncbi:protein PFC0760c-like isoform X2 [Scylla paramamosain]|uniref:protein PFC0760c-like isoform X2 n=1 Tax=Scylla paramamosain TaxID=85552 RepID=UPI0030835589